MKRSVWLACGVVLAACAISPERAQAYSGFIKGRLAYDNDSSGFCPAGGTCTGWRFFESQTTRPDHDSIRWIKVYLRDTEGNIAGMGSTNASGNYQIFWTTPIALTGAWIEFWGEDVDGIYRLENITGFYTATFTLIDGTTPSSPQVSNWWWSRLDAANALGNAADTASMFLGSSVLANNMHNVRIRMFDDAGGTCATACARWHEASQDGRIYLPVDAGFNRLGRVSHELGHIAAHNGSGGRHFSWESDAVNGFETDRDGSGWSNGSAEYYGTATNEAVATFLGSLGTFNANAFNPLQCSQWSGACPNGNTSRMETEESCGNFVTPERRHYWIIKWLWDIYDTGEDTCGTSTVDTTSMSIGGFVDVLQAFPSGRDNHERSEHVCCFIECYTCDSEDGRNTGDYDFHLPSTAQDLRSCDCALQ